MKKIKKIDFSNILKRYSNRANDVLAIDFGLNVISCLYLIRASGILEVKKSQSASYSLADESGKSSVVDFIKSFSSDIEIKNTSVILGVSDYDQIFLKSLTMPSIPENELLSAVKWQLKEESPFDIEQAQIDWIINDSFKDEEGTKKLEILTYCVKKEFLSKILVVLKDCSLNPICLTSGPINFASERVISIEKSFAVLSLDSRQAVIHVYKNNKLSFTRFLPIQWEKFIASLKEQNGESSAVQNTLRELDLLREGGESVKLMSLARPYFEAIVREVRFSLNYCSREQSLNVEHLLITGIGAQSNNLDSYLAKELELNCELMLSKLRQQLSEEQAIFVNAISVANDDLQSINILKKNFRLQEFAVLQKKIIELSVIFVGLLFIILNFSVHRSYKNNESKLSNLKVKMNGIGVISELSEKISVNKNALNNIYSNKVPVDGLLVIVSQSINEEIILDEMRYSQDSHILELMGKVDAEENRVDSILTDFVNKLEETQFIKEARVVNSSTFDGVHVFSIKCEVFKD